MRNLFSNVGISRPQRQRYSSHYVSQWLHADSSSSSTSAVGGADDRREKVVVLLGATGGGKTRLSVDLAARFNGEIINSDKTQLYQGLDITTNKIPISQRRGVRHHLLGDIDPSRTQVSPSDYRSLASSAISEITARSRLPVLAGGSNSFVHALLARHFRAECDVFRESGPASDSQEVRYDCCFLWVDVEPPVLDAYLEKRVDDMMKSGMLYELAEFFATEGVDSGTRPAFRKAIGLPEFSDYFRLFPHPEKGPGIIDERRSCEMIRTAVREIKENTRQLARSQMRKILKLRELSWNLRRIETTAVFRAVMSPDSDARTAHDVYEKQVLEPAAQIVGQFLEN